MPLSTVNDAAESWRLIRGAAANAKRFAQAYSAELAGGDAKLERVFDMYRNLRNIRNQINAEGATSGLVDFVKLVRGDAAYDVSADIAAVLTAIDACLTWVDTNASGLNLSGDSAANYLNTGSVVTNRFTPQQTSGLRTRLDAVVASIG